MQSYIGSYGVYVPDNIVFNSELSQFPQAALGLIKIKTGIESRHIAKNELSSEMAIKSVENCLSKVSIDRNSIDLLIFASSTPDRTIPATATLVATKTGLNNAFAFDINSVCTSGLAALMLAKNLVEAGSVKNVVVVAADIYSKILNPKDFSTFPYFGDGSAAILVTSEPSKLKLSNSLFKSDGNGYEVITVKAGATEIRPSEISKKEDAYFTMEGRNVFEFATNRVPPLILNLLKDSGITPEQIRQIVLHQANINIVKKISESLGLDSSLFFTNLQKYGNTAGASCLIALSEYLDGNLENLSSGYIVVSSFGGGLSWGASLIEIL